MIQRNLIEVKVQVEKHDQGLFTVLYLKSKMKHQCNLMIPKIEHKR